MSGSNPPSYNFSTTNNTRAFAAAQEATTAPARRRKKNKAAAPAAGAPPPAQKKPRIKQTFASPYADEKTYQHREELARASSSGVSRAASSAGTPSVHGSPAGTAPASREQSTTRSTPGARFAGGIGRETELMEGLPDNQLVTMQGVPVTDPHLYPEEESTAGPAHNVRDLFVHCFTT